MNSSLPHKLLKKRIFWHLLFWIVATFYLAFAFRGNTESFPFYLNLSIIHLPGHIFFVYIMIYYLIPEYALQKRFVTFFLWLIPVILICSIYVRFVDTNLFHSTETFTDKRLFLRSIFANFNLCGIAVAIKLFKYWYTEKEAKLEAELQLLKSQVHPHFLFNTLNNLYSLTLDKSPQASVVVLKLSSLLRYMLYECSGAEVSLEKEIDVLRNYIELERIRYGKRLDVSFLVNGYITGKKIAPLLLLPLLENSFKHGASEQIDICWITVDISVKGNIFYLKLINGVAANHEEKKGIGLTNVKKRLELLYKNAYAFEAVRHDEAFTVSLELELKPLYQTIPMYEV